MDEIVDRFSLQDFLAYFFPGVIANVGIYLIILITPFGQSLTVTSIDITTMLLLFILSYVVGILMSGFSKLILPRVFSLRNLPDPRSTPPYLGFDQEFLDAYKIVFASSKAEQPQWSPHIFYLCRSLIYNAMPQNAHISYRQGVLRQLRVNLFVPILIWFIAGIIWGFGATQNIALIWRSTLIIFIIACTIGTLNMLVTNMYESAMREAREIYTAFLSGYKTGIFDDRRETQEKRFSSEYLTDFFYRTTGPVQDILSSIKSIQEKKEKLLRDDEYLLGEISAIESSAQGLLLMIAEARKKISGLD